MYLKKIELRGFKTFADKTELEFRPGITAIVGPNGTGKSNISDAIVWGLGEQSHRSLRTESSQDLIFAGSEKRRPLGMSEVCLTIDNGDGALPVDYSEIVVSRRLFRSGDSEYLLNRATVRLRDIRDLLLDTGVGPGAYSVVGQGEIDAILSIRSEDRRELLEEVAGVRRYRFRRDEATRKLEATQANVTRVLDIVAELTSQREPLEEQAEKARQYNAHNTRLRDLDLHLLAGDYQRRRLRVGKLSNEVEITRADLQGTRNQLSELEAEFERVQFELVKLADEVDHLRDETARAERALDQARQAQELAQERARAAATRASDLQARVESHHRRGADLTAQLGTVGREHEEVRAELARAEEARATLDAALKEKAAAYQEKMGRVRELEKSQAQLLEKARALENEALALQSLELDLGERSERLTRQAEGLETRESELGEALQAAQARGEELAARLAAGQQEAEALRGDLKRASRILQEHRQKCNIFSGAVTASETRQALLQELESSHEGFSDGARKVVQAAGEGQLEGVLGLVADLVDVPARFERAYEAALGEALQWVVTETEEQAEKAARYVVEAEAGRVTLLPLSAFTGGPQAAPASVPSLPGVMGPALKHARVRKGHERLLSHLLGDTVVVRDLDVALACRQQFRARTRYVTLAGELVDGDGVITAGGEGGAGTQAFARRRELETLSAELEGLRLALADMWQREENLDRWTAQLSDQIQALDQELSGLRSQQATARADAGHLADQQKAAKQAAAELAEEVEALAGRLQGAATRRETAMQESEDFRLQGQEVGQQVEEMRRSGVGQAEVEALRAQQVTAQVQAAELAEKERAVAHLKARLTAESARIADDLAGAEEELAAARETEAELAEALATPGENLLDLEKGAATSRATLTERSGALSQLRETSAELEAMRVRMGHVIEEQSERIHRSELAMAREEAQVEAIVQRLEDQYKLTPDEAFEERYQEVSETEIRREAEQLREAIRQLGVVNLSAIDECERLRAREEFLQGQLDDLERARQDLLQVIAEIDEAATVEFMRSYERMQVEFQEMFTRLFNGGHTELRLTNPESPLESGVDVMVQVPGKRQQNLLLLSGGERALTAMALLFAMLRVRPTPFCVMDEIDAALDENNVGRFVAVLKDFAQASQFIIVTHNPHTIEAADTLFGVTMQEPGVSRLIKLELREWEGFLADAEEQVAGLRAPRAGTRVLPVSGE